MALAGLSGIMSGKIEKESDYQNRSMLWDACEALLPAILEYADSGPVAFILKCLLKVCTERPNFPLHDRQRAVRLIYDFIESIVNTSVDQFAAGCIKDLVKVCRDSVEDCSVRVCALRVICNLICKLTNPKPEIVDKLIKILSSFKHLDIDVSPMINISNSNVDVELRKCALDVYIHKHDLGKTFNPLQTDMNILKELVNNSYLKDPVSHVKELVVCYQVCHESKEVDDAFKLIVKQSKLVLCKKELVAFDELNSELSLKLELDNVNSELITPFCRCLDPEWVWNEMLESKDSLKDLLKLIAILIHSQLERKGLLEEVLALEDIMSYNCNQHFYLTWLVMIEKYIARYDLDYSECGAVLSCLLGSLAGECMYERQVTEHALDRLVKKQAAVCLNNMIDEYREHLFDVALGMLRDPWLYLKGPDLLLNLLTSSNNTQPLSGLARIIMRIDELFENHRTSLPPHYMSSLVKCLNTIVQIAKKFDPVVKQEKVLNDEIVDLAFSASINMLSSEHLTVQRETLFLIEACCEYYNLNGDGDQDCTREKRRQSFLPNIHKSWDRCFKRLGDEDKRIQSVVVKVITALIRHDPSFVRGKLTSDGGINKLLNSGACVSGLLKEILLCEDILLDLVTVERILAHDRDMLDVLLQSNQYSDIGYYYICILESDYSLQTHSRKVSGRSGPALLTKVAADRIPAK